jgi:RNA polymerase sigma-70 factor (ECF subfamily)
LVLALPPKERACLLLKDVFNYSLDEVADIVGSTNGGVKASLHRARAKLDSRMSGGPKAARKMGKPEAAQVLKLYVERFNKQDWEGVRDLIAADAKLLVADRFSGRLTDAPYFSRYAAMSEPWRFAIGTIDGEPALIALRLRDSTWTAVSVARVEVNDGLVRSVVDYTHCDWVFALAGSVVVSEG